MAARDNEFFENFLREIFGVLRSPEGVDIAYQPEQASQVLASINRFFYQEDKDNGKEYISRFHKFWEVRHEEILGFRIDDAQCRKVASVLERAFASRPFKVDSNVAGLSPQLIANVRFFTIVQDFKIRFRGDPYELARRRPSLFDAKSILANFPVYTNELLQFLGADSQIDKRHKFSRLGAEFLLKYYDGNAFDMASKFESDAAAIIQNLISNPDGTFAGTLGFSSKKAIIFVRDMMDYGVWHLKNPETLDLPSDSNTMKVALRTGILRTRIPLLASYLDVYCAQYAATDDWCRRAWRRVWDLWDEVPNNHRLSSPASFDFLVYRVGQNWNKPAKMPEVGLFKQACPPDTIHLNPPKSISIYGRTGWESGRTNEGGGGGIMS